MGKDCRWEWLVCSWSVECGPSDHLASLTHKMVYIQTELWSVACCNVPGDPKCKNLNEPQLSSASSKSFSRRQQTSHTRHKTKCLKFSCYSSHSLVEQHKVTRTSQKQKTAVPTADSRSKVVSDNILRNNQRFRPNV